MILLFGQHSASKMGVVWAFQSFLSIQLIFLVSIFSSTFYQTSHIRKLTKYFFDFYGFFVPFWTFAWQGHCLTKKSKKVKCIHEKFKKHEKSMKLESTAE